MSKLHAPIKNYRLKDFAEVLVNDTRSQVCRGQSLKWWLIQIVTTSTSASGCRTRQDGSDRSRCAKCGKALRQSWLYQVRWCQMAAWFSQEPFVEKRACMMCSPRELHFAKCATKTWDYWIARYRRGGNSILTPPVTGKDREWDRNPALNCLWIVEQDAVVEGFTTLISSALQPY